MVEEIALAGMVLTIVCAAASLLCFLLSGVLGLIAAFVKNEAVQLLAIAAAVAMLVFTLAAGTAAMAQCNRWLAPHSVIQGVERAEPQEV